MQVHVYLICIFREIMQAVSEAPQAITVLSYSCDSEIFFPIAPYK